MTIRDLKPALIWSIFDDITRVPRPSKKEEKSVNICSISPLSMAWP